MQSRRGVLKAVLGLWLLPPILLPLVPHRAAAAPGGFHLVNGRVLTDRDLAALRATADRPAP